jgi:predicted phosphohydrolase
MEQPEVIAYRMITPDGTIIQSRHRHDYQTHIDTVSGETYMIDGGNNYLRRSVNKMEATLECIMSNDSHDKIREVMTWGTRGKSGRDPLKWVFLKDMDTNHIEAVLDTQTQITSQIRSIFETELKYRENQ